MKGAAKSSNDLCKGGRFYISPGAYLSSYFFVREFVDQRGKRSGGLSQPMLPRFARFET